MKSLLIITLTIFGYISSHEVSTAQLDLDNEIRKTYQANQKSVVIENVEVSHNSRLNGQWGMNISVDFKAYNLKSTNCQLAGYFYLNSEERLRDYNGKYTTSDKQVFTREGFRPRYTNSVYSDFTLFIPYSELHINKGERYYLKVVIAAEISDSRFGSKHLGWSNFVSFNVKI